MVKPLEDDRFDVITHGEWHNGQGFEEGITYAEAYKTTSRKTRAQAPLLS